MFTGIIKEIGTVEQVERKPGLVTFGLRVPNGYLDGVKTGASVAVDGACLTVTRIEDGLAFFDAMDETLRKTTIGEIEEGQRRNVERSFRVGDEIGGHVVSGHVTGIAEIVRVETPENNHVITFRVSPGAMKYIFPKGFIALDGASLTIVDVDREKAEFTVWLIPETLGRSTFGAKRAGDKVNVEIDSQTQVIVETVERVLAQHEA